MKRLLTMGALALIAILGAGCSGCTTLTTATKAVTAEQPILAGQKIDEQALGGVYALGASANVLAVAVAKSGVASRDQLLTAQKIRRGLDAGVAASEAAYRLGDAAGFKARMAALTDLNKQATALYKEVLP